MKILDPVDVLGLNTLLIHKRAVIGHVVVYVLNLLDKLFGLKLFDVLDGHRLNFSLIIIFFHRWVLSLFS